MGGTAGVIGIAGHISIAGRPGCIGVICTE
jgi:hypothetical protein